MTAMRRFALGFSLIELMIAMLLGLLSIAAVGTVFIYGSRNYKQDDRTQRMQDELRFGMAQLTQDIEMTAFWAQVRDPVNDIDLDSSASIANAASDCGPPPVAGTVNSTNNWVYQERRASLITLGNVTSGTTANSVFPCISATEFYVNPASAAGGTDIIGLKRLAGSPLTGTESSAASYLRTNGVQTTLYQGGACTTCPTGTGLTTYQYQPVVWYIRKYATANQNPQIPALCRKVLNNGAMQDDPNGCAAQGIENMQLEFGFDGNGDGAPDYYTEYSGATPPSIGTLTNIIAVRIHLLARSLDPSPDATYLNNKTYQLAGVTVGPMNDKYYRKSLSTVVLLRNQSYRLSPYALPE